MCQNYNQEALVDAKNLLANIPSRERRWGTETSAVIWKLFTLKYFTYNYFKHKYFHPLAMVLKIFYCTELN